jgi:hypothetical protein
MSNGVRLALDEGDGVGGAAMSWWDFLTLLMASKPKPPPSRSHRDHRPSRRDRSRASEIHGARLALDARDGVRERQACGNGCTISLPAKQPSSAP